MERGTLEITYPTPLVREQGGKQSKTKQDSSPRCALFPRTLQSPPVLSPLIYRLADSRCSGAKEAEGTLEGGGVTGSSLPLRSSPLDQKKAEQAGASLGMQKPFSCAASARAQGRTSANLVLFSRCQQERKLKDTWLVWGALWEMSLTSAPRPDPNGTLGFYGDPRLGWREEPTWSRDKPGDLSTETLTPLMKKSWA